MRYINTVNNSTTFDIMTHLCSLLKYQNIWLRSKKVTVAM